MANEREKREQNPDSGWTGQMHDPALRPGEHGDAPEVPAPGGALQGNSELADDESTVGSGLAGATASDDEQPRGASPPA